LWRHRFRKAPFSNCFPSTRKQKAGVVKSSLRFEERFRRTDGDGLVWTEGLTVELKLRFQTSPAYCEDAVREFERERLQSTTLGTRGFSCAVSGVGHALRITEKENKGWDNSQSERS